VLLGRRVLKLLLVLLDAKGELVSNEELLKQVWAGVVVEHNTLQAHISLLRKALGEDRELLKTYSGRGYRLISSETRELIPGQGSVASQDVVSGDKVGPQPAPGEPVPTGPPGNLPRRLGTVIGRAVELAELAERISLNRLVTLVGPGGIGKTRLAIELGWQVSRSFPAGVWLIDLAPLTDPALVISATATALGVPLRDAGAGVEAIAAALGRQRRLLLFDNCEHLVVSVAEVIEALLGRAVGLSVLVTSQESLGIRTEHVYRLNPLAVPPPGATEIADFGAVALFVERARAVVQNFALAPGNAAGVAEICRRLDGIPLALEMAAGRLPLLGIEGLRVGLGERLGMLRTNLQSGETRYHSLSAMVEWSAGLLGAAEQAFFRRLGVFSGSFSLEAAIAIAGEDGAERWDIVDMLGRLIDKSLVSVETGEPRRYRLLETLRLYALERLKASGESAAIAERHARYFTDFLDHAYEQWHTTPDAEWCTTYRPELENIRAALDWALADPGRALFAVALMGSSGPMWDRFAIVEGMRYFERALSHIDEKTPPAAAARCMLRAGTAWRESRMARALPLYEQSASIYRQLDDQPNLASALALMGHLLAYFGRYAESKTVLDEALAILATRDYKKALQAALTNLGILAALTNDPAGARDHFVRALEVARQLRDAFREGNVYIDLAEVEFSHGSVARAVELARDSVRRLRSVDTTSGAALWSALHNLGSYLIVQGNLTEARPISEELLSAVESGIAQGHFRTMCLLQWALLGALEGRCEEAAQLLGFVDAAYANSGEPREPTEQKLHEHVNKRLEVALPVDQIQARAKEGANWSEAAAVAFACNHLAGAKTSL